MPPINSTSKDNWINYTQNEIKARSHSHYQTHDSGLLSKLYSIARIFTKPAESGVYWALIASRAGEGSGRRRGAGGVSKKYAPLKSAAWFSAALLSLPLVVIGFIGKQLLHPGRGRDNLQFMDATKSYHSYIQPKLDQNEKIHLATYNIAGLPPLVDALKDVAPAAKRMKEFSDWLRRQENGDLPLMFGLQEAFDQDAAAIFCQETKHLYPFAVTSAGWSKIPFLGNSSGLQVYSRVPIKSAAFYPFEDLKGFGIKCSARGVLKVELELGQGKSALVYVTHTQAHAEEEDRKIRENELKLIAQHMREDRAKDLKEGNDRGGHYYLMGDLNVANVDDETGKEIGEYDSLRKKRGVLNEKMFYDPYLEEHRADGLRIKGEPLFLEKDVKNKARFNVGYQEIKEPEGSFYMGADRKNRGKRGYGTKNFYKGPHQTLKSCRYDYVLRLRAESDYSTHGIAAPSFTGKAEIRHVLPKKITTMPISDHAMVSAIFEKNCSL